MELTQEYAEGDYTLAKVETVSKLILTQEERGTDRDVIFLEVGGWDHHEQLKNNLSLDLQNLNRVIDTFQKEMEAQNMWDQVTLVVASEFARTLTANSGEGSDHGKFSCTFSSRRANHRFEVKISLNYFCRLVQRGVAITWSWVEASMEERFTGSIQQISLQADLSMWAVVV